MKKYVPNALTVFRGVITMVIVLLFFLDIPYKWWIVFGCFFVASLTDFFDGHLARRWGVVSDFGIVFDSLFDKILTLSLYILLIPYDILPIWVWILFLVRELFVDSLKNFCSGKGCPMPAIWTGKWKFVFQVILIHLCLLFLIFSRNVWIGSAIYIIATGALVLAYVSASIYIRKFLSFLRK